MSVCLTTNIGNAEPLTVMVSTAPKSADGESYYNYLKLQILLVHTQEYYFCMIILLSFN